ncbi:MAG: asparagine--tRNA ligase [Clostridia bacterium]|nr:asparagine--tRNA ligase [Clostridia bacterium]
MKHTDIRDVMEQAEYIGKEVTVCGWVRTSRDSKTMAFAELNDGTTFKHIQIVINKNEFAQGDELPAFLRLGVALCVTGEVVPSVVNKEGGVEINATQIELLGDCPADYPLQKKRHTLEFLRTMPHIRLRSNTFNAVFRVRSVLAAALHEYFQQNGYVYINTPLITGSDCEGAGEMFQVTTHQYGDEADYEDEAAYYADDFFGQPAGLSVSGQLEGEMAATAFGKIYTFGPSFRAEKSNTQRHVAEFWHVEPEVAFAELPEVLEIAEDMMKYVIRAVMERCPTELEFFNKFMEKGLLDKLQNVVDSDFAVLDYTEAIDLLQKADADFKFPVSWGMDLQTEHERYITEQIYKKPVFVINYPKDIKSFYMKQNDDGKTVAAADLLVPGVGEIIGGSEREADYDKLIAAMEERGMDMSAYADYLDLRKYGTVPHGGYGLGFERLVMYVTGVQNIRDVILFPRTVGNIR